MAADMEAPELGGKASGVSGARGKAPDHVVAPWLNACLAGAGCRSHLSRTKISDLQARKSLISFTSI